MGVGMQENKCEYITVRQLATMLGASVTSVRKAIYNGHFDGLHIYRIGKGKIRFSRSEIYQWLKQHSERIDRCHNLKR